MLIYTDPDDECYCRFFLDNKNLQSVDFFSWSFSLNTQPNARQPNHANPELGGLFLSYPFSTNLVPDSSVRALLHYNSKGQNYNECMWKM